MYWLKHFFYLIDHFPGAADSWDALKLHCTYNSKKVKSR